MPFDELLIGIDAAQLQNHISHRGFDQHGDIAAGFDLNDHLAHRNAQYVLRQRLIGNAVVFTLQSFAANQMNDHLKPHLAAHGRLAKNRLDVEQADAAHFEQILQQVRAAALDDGLVDAGEFNRVIGNQAMAARNQLQPELAFAKPRLAGNHHAHAQNVHEHAVHRRALGKMP